MKEVRNIKIQRLTSTRYKVSGIVGCNEVSFECVGVEAFDLLDGSEFPIINKQAYKYCEYKLNNL